MKNRTRYYPIFKRPDGAVGTGSGYDSVNEVLDNLAERDAELIEPDIKQWVKIVETKFIEVQIVPVGGN